MRSFNAEGTFETEDGERITLVCDFSTIDVVQGITGQNWDDVMPQLAEFDRALLTKILWAMLRKRHEGISLDEAAALGFDKNSIALWAIMGDVINRACNISDDKPAEDEAAKKKSRGRSKSSAASG